MKKDFTEILTSRLKEIRLENNLSQQDVADFLHVTRETYCRYEGAKRKIGVEDVSKLADFYKVPVDYLLGKID